jgi:hypothetical protein
MYSSFTLILPALIKDEKNLIIYKSSELKANYFAIARRHNCTHIKQYKKGIIINQSHKSRQRHWNVIGWRRNVRKSCLDVAKSSNNVMEKKSRRHRWWLSRNKIGSLRLSQNQHLFATFLNQLVRFEGILIFVTAMSQQGVRLKH